MTRTQVLITVDVETLNCGGRLLHPEHSISGRAADGTLYGVDVIMSLCEARGFRATFFVDALLHYRFGRQLMGRLYRAIDERGHDVEMHIHPNSMPGFPRPFMSDYPFEAQLKLVRAGSAFLRDCTGTAPVAFRAGSYGANLDTIRALKAAGITADSSYFAFHPNCMLSRELANRWRNRVFGIGSVLEIPVTIYRMLRPYFYRDYHSKIDVNACSARELLFVTESLIGKLDALVLFLHCFSFVHWDNERNCMIPDLAVLDKFRQVLDFLAGQREADIVTVRQYCDRFEFRSPAAGDTSDAVTDTGIGMTFERVAQRYQRKIFNVFNGFNVP